MFFLPLHVHACVIGSVETDSWQSLTLPLKIVKDAFRPQERNLTEYLYVDFLGQLSHVLIPDRCPMRACLHLFRFT